MFSLPHFVGHFTLKITDIFHHILGWIAAIGLFVVDIFSGHAFIVNLVVAVTIMDAVWGIAVSLKGKKFALSELGRLTIGKIAVYGCALFGFAGLDLYIQAQTGLEMTVTTSVIGCAIVLVELWSSFASMLILFPDFPILHIMQKALTGEIARKLQIPEEEVTKVLHPHKTTRKTAKNGSAKPKKQKVSEESTEGEISSES